jgi:molybdopterin synthase sulfur carrier subunit
MHLAKRSDLMVVNFYATLRDIAGGKTTEFPLNGDLTAGELLNAIIARYPAMRDELLNNEGLLYGHVHFIINGRDVRFLEDDLETRLDPEDVISVFPAVGGG